MGDSPVRSIAALASLEAGAAIRVRGRVLESDGLEATLADPTGRVQLRLSPVSPHGALVEGLATRQPDGTLTLAITTIHATPHAEGLHPEGDVRRLLGASGRARRIVQRASGLRAVRGFFEAREYVEIETPTLVPNPGMDVHLDAFRVEGTRGERFLATSPEYAMKRLVAAGFERVFQVTRSYRRDEAGRHHEPEFTLLEWYRAYVGMEQLMAETELLCAEVVAACNDGNRWVQRAGHRLDLTPPWPVLTVREALRIHADADLDALLQDETAFFETLATRVQPELGQTQPVWLVDWPIEHASLARAKPSDPRVAERFEAYAQGIELCNGFGELTDPFEQRRRFEADRAARVALGKPAYPLDERFLAALEDGFPPCSGNALGFDRLMMIATAALDIDDVVAIGTRQLG